MTDSQTNPQDTSVADLLAAIDELETAPSGLKMADRVARLEKARALHRNAFALWKSSQKTQSVGILERATDLLDEIDDQLSPPEFWDAYDKLKAGDDSGLEIAVEFLEVDPWYFRTGYVKADLLKFISRLSLDDGYKLRLQNVILKAVCLRDRREFRYYCRLAKTVQSREFRDELKKLMQHSDPDVCRRASWVLKVCRKAKQKSQRIDTPDCHEH